jgi:effector-binding domain-containing protein
MNSKHVPPIPVIFFSTRTSLKELGQFTYSIAKKLYEEAAKQGLLPSGPLQWIYIGADGKADTVFALEIALPVHGQVKKDSAFPHKQLPPFDCISTIHHGAWEHLFETYDHLIDDIHSKGRKMTGFCREQYLYMDLDNPANNITEVQIGI